MPTSRQKCLSGLIVLLRSEISEINPLQLKRRLDSHGGLVLIDVRDPDELENGLIPGSVHLSRGFLEFQVEDYFPNKDAEMVTYCGDGTRSLLAAKTLRTLGYAHVWSLQGGVKGWTEAGFRVETALQLSAEQKRRYSHQLKIPEIGESVQLKLLRSKVLIIGAGALGSPAAMYLTAAGIGKLGILDSDRVHEDDLHCEVIHTTSRIGNPKVESMREAVLELNPSVQVTEIAEELSPENIDRILSDYDLVIDGSEDFQARYMISDGCAKKHIPCVHGSVHRFQGQVTVLDPRRGGPCYRCLFPSAPSQKLSSANMASGALGVLAGVIGTLQATEAIKILGGIGEPLVGRMLCYDALRADFKQISVQRRSDCLYCRNLIEGDPHTPLSPGALPRPVTPIA